MKKRRDKEQRKRDKQMARLRPLLGKKLCACGSMYMLKCKGECRKAHTDKDGLIQCTEVYELDPQLINPKARQSKRKSIDFNKKDDGRKRRRDKKVGYNKSQGEKE